MGPMIYLLIKSIVYIETTDHVEVTGPKNKNQKIEILNNRYNSSFAWSYGFGVGTVKIPVKNCIDSWGQILKNRLFGPVTSK